MRRFEKLVLLGGDIIIFYISVLFMLLASRDALLIAQYGREHLITFTILLPLWLFALYVFDFYHPRHLRSHAHLAFAWAQVVAINVAVGIIFFYLVQPFGISPKTNLLIFLIIFSISFLGWRLLARRWMWSHRPKTRVALMQLSEDERAATEGLTSPLYEMTDSVAEADVLVFGRDEAVCSDAQFRAHVMAGKEIQSFMTHVETVLMQVPVGVLERELTQFSLPYRRELHVLKRAFDIMCSLIHMVVLLPVVAVAALAVWLSSDGPIIYRQTRVGLRQKLFTLYKFRTMFIDAEQNGHQWSGKGDARVTAVGRILRHTHLDELPQLWNILKGDMTFVGPRPERPEMIVEIEQHVPLFSLRHIVRPGITGWAQVNFRYGASMEDAKKKLAYDLYYVKHQTAFLDAKIVFQTIAHIVIGENHSS